MEEHIKKIGWHGLDPGCFEVLLVGATWCCAPGEHAHVFALVFVQHPTIVLLFDLQARPCIGTHDEAGPH